MFCHKLNWPTERGQHFHSYFKFIWQYTASIFICPHLPDTQQTLAECMSHSFQEWLHSLSPRTSLGCAWLLKFIGTFICVLKKKKGARVYIIRPKFHFLLKTKNILVLKRQITKVKQMRKRFLNEDVKVPIVTHPCFSSENLIRPVI